MKKEEKNETNLLFLDQPSIFGVVFAWKSILGSKLA